MMLRTAFLIVFLVGGSPLWAQTGSAPNAANTASEPMVLAGIFTIRPDGSFGSSAAQDGHQAGADLAGKVYMSFCGTIGATNPRVSLSEEATEVWELVGSVLTLSPDEASVRIGWQRTRRNGENVTSTPNLRTLTLRRGERVTLEPISVPASGTCAERRGSLDVVFASMPELLEERQRRAARAVAQGNPNSVRLYSSSRGNVKQTGVAQDGQTPPTALNAELWLVCSAPGRPDQTIQITSPVLSIPQKFVFNPMVIEAPAGAMLVRVEGTIEVSPAGGGERRLLFSASRSATFSPYNRPARDGGPVVEGSTRTTVDLPNPDGVISFEMPPLRIPGGDVLPDSLSIRVRITPSPMREVTRAR